MSETLLRTVIVDDEPLARGSIRALLLREPEIEIVGEFGDGPSAIAGVAAQRPDIVLLDIQMPGMDGFEVLRQLGPSPPPLIIFVTAYDSYAVRAFENLALDYLLKPCSSAQLRRALDRARQHLSSERLSEIGRRMLKLLDEESGMVQATAPEAPHLKRLVVRKRGRTVLVDAEMIDWIEADDYCVKIHTAEGSHLLRRSLKWLGEHLDPKLFVRAHRSALVNLTRVKEIRHLATDDHLLVLRDGQEVPLSKSGRINLTKLLEPGAG